ncbi:hypothetical protein [Clostridium sp.]|jgi:hypothetical protein|uniref:hypothetical protein n=1 Tax=Clostridium sp. TaxID=1506 RepID=UPI003EEC0158
MKLILYSIIFGISGLILAKMIFSIGGEAGDFGIILGGVIGFFSPGLYILNKLYEKSQKEEMKE